MKRDDRGLSLVELVVVIAVIGILTAALGRYVTAGAGFLRQVSSTSRAQMDIQELADTLENHILNANWRISYDETGAELLLGETESRTAPVSGESTTLKTTVTKWAVDRYVYSEADKTITYQQFTLENTSGASTEAGTAQILAEGVESFALDLSGLGDTNDSSITFTLKMQVKGESTSLVRTVHLRNQPENCSPLSGSEIDTAESGT